MTAITLALPARYRGTELIASGGMADVYAATDETLDRRVAIKILNERFAGDPEIRARFAREARIAARLSTEPNVDHDLRRRRRRGSARDRDGVPPGGNVGRPHARGPFPRHSVSRGSPRRDAHSMLPTLRSRPP